MGISVWYLGIDENKKLHRLPLSIFKGNKSKLHNQIVKAVELVIENENRKPSKVLRALYFKLKFKEDGTIDDVHYDEGTRLKFNSFNMFGEKLTSDQIIAREKYEQRYSWIPSSNEIKLINQYLNNKGIPLNKLLKKQLVLI